MIIIFCICHFSFLWFGLIIFYSRIQKHTHKLFLDITNCTLYINMFSYIVIEKVMLNLNSINKRDSWRLDFRKEGTE